MWNYETSKDCTMTPLFGSIIINNIYDDQQEMLSQQFCGLHCVICTNQTLNIGSVYSVKLTGHLPRHNTLPAAFSLYGRGGQYWRNNKSCGYTYIHAWMVLLRMVLLVGLSQFHIPGYPVPTEISKIIQKDEEDQGIHICKMIDYAGSLRGLDVVCYL